MKQSVKNHENLVNFFGKMFKKHSTQYKEDLKSLEILSSYRDGFFVGQNLPKFILKQIYNTKYFGHLSQINKNIISNLIDQKSLFLLKEVIRYIKIHICHMNNMIHYSHDNDLDLIKNIIKKFNLDDRVTFQKDPNLISGFILEIDNKVIDYSIAGRIRKLKKELQFSNL